MGSLFTFNIYQTVDNAEVLRELKHLKTFMAGEFALVKAEFEALKVAIAEERAQATAKLNELNQSIIDLTANIQNGGTEQERTELLADITAQIAEVKAIIPDAQPDPNA